MFSKIRIISLVILLLLFSGAFLHVEAAETAKQANPDADNGNDDNDEGQEDQEDQENQNTVITYIYEHQDEQEENFIEITVKIENRNPSLVSALNEATKIVSDVTDVVTKECEKDEKQGDCDDGLVEVDNYVVTPNYQTVKRDQIFKDFTVEHELVIKVMNPDTIGSVVDSVLKCGVTQILEFSWIPEDQKDSEKQAIRQGLKLGKKLCRTIDLIYDNFVSVEQIPQQEGEDQQQTLLTYKFEVQCRQKTPEDPEQDPQDQDDEDEDDEDEDEGGDDDEDQDEDQENKNDKNDKNDKNSKKGGNKKEEQPAAKSQKKAQKPKASGAQVPKQAVADEKKTDQQKVKKAKKAPKPTEQAAPVQEQQQKDQALKKKKKRKSLKSYDYYDPI